MIISAQNMYLCIIIIPSVTFYLVFSIEVEEVTPPPLYLVGYVLYFLVLSAWVIIEVFVHALDHVSYEFDIYQAGK